MAQYNKTTEKTFTAIKILLNGGASQKEAAEYMNVSTYVTWLVDKSETFEEYQHYVAEKSAVKARNRQLAALHAKEAEKKKETPVITDDKQKGGTMSANYQINRMYDVMKQMSETLTLMSNKLTFVVDELTK
jgi:hypothetical protein